MQSATEQMDTGYKLLQCLQSESVPVWKENILNAAMILLTNLDMVNAR